jgi:hypothetical protein
MPSKTNAKKVAAKKAAPTKKADTTKRNTYADVQKIMLEAANIGLQDSVQITSSWETGVLGFPGQPSRRQSYGSGVAYTVTKITPTGVVVVPTRGSGYSTITVPAHVLRLRGPSIRINSDYIAEVQHDASVKVGCTTVHFEKLKEIYEAALAMSKKTSK